MAREDNRDSPDEERISRQRNESESDSGGEGGLEEVDLQNIKVSFDSRRSWDDDSPT